VTVSFARRALIHGVSYKGGGYKYISLYVDLINVLVSYSISPQFKVLCLGTVLQNFSWTEQDGLVSFIYFPQIGGVWVEVLKPVILIIFTHHKLECLPYYYYWL